MASKIHLNIILLSILMIFSLCNEVINTNSAVVPDIRLGCNDCPTISEGELCHQYTGWRCAQGMTCHKGRCCTGAGHIYKCNKSTKKNT